ncbi:hybrid sensor histidine kinase/response regulator [Candidatus Viridilinea mediisalina]|uniref:histidine kinase n=1 Tax=Candidatus Viridilinea mediisalina TaxID=2024553 RepID=A0A2A6RHD5_9CHLR|nr:hybrid sensor histidine kinase/response regulator [Candidatus Viridilinea mediisalina]PDW02432.1 hybrid sensor histidine kinase/response regulator [Candidatus Viridilinea mediisalina]
MSEAQPKILYIEDNHDNQRLVQRVLGARGYQILIAADGPAGLTLARESMPTLILVDLGIPGLDGYETTTRLRSMSHLQGVPIVALTADDSPGARERALVAGCDGYLSKPIDARQLPNQIAQFIGGHREQVSEPHEEATLLRAYNQKLVERLEQRVRELSAANSELQELDRLKSQFLSSLSHELRTPLTALIGYLDLFERGMLGELDPSQREVITVMRRSGDLLATQLNNLLYFQELRERPLNLQLVNPLEIMQPISSQTGRYAQELGLSFEALSGEITPTMLDPAAFDQLVRVLLDNAIKFTPAGGHIRLVLHSDTTRLIVRVEDNGPGIESEQLNKIFLPFYYIEQPCQVNRPGAGLGLAIARHIAEAHGGQITVRSQLDQGSVFTVVLPLMV